MIAHIGLAVHGLIPSGTIVSKKMEEEVSCDELKMQRRIEVPSLAAAAKGAPETSANRVHNPSNACISRRRDEEKSYGVGSR